MTDTLGYRAMFGLLVPYFNTVVEPELADLRPTGVSNQTARFALDADVLQRVGDAAAGLAGSELSAILVGLSTESFPGGLDFLQQGADQVRARTDRPVFTASHATQAALRALGASRVAVVTPFDDAANIHVRDALQTNGFEVSAIAGLAWPRIETIGQTPSAAIRDLFLRVDRRGADAIVQIGTGLPVLKLIEQLESDLGAPIVACNAALYWQALRATGIDDEILGYGQLLRSRGVG